MQSIQSKISVGLLLSLIIAFTVLWILVSINIQFLAKEYIATRLEHDAEMLLSTIYFDNEGMLTIDSSRTDLIYNQPFSGHYYVVSTDKQEINSRSLWDHKLNVKPSTRANCYTHYNKARSSSLYCLSLVVTVNREINLLYQLRKISTPSIKI